MNEHLSLPRMKHSHFSVVIVVCTLFIPDVIISIHSLRCDGLSPDYFCISEASAELCQMQEYCKILWKNENSGADVKDIANQLTQRRKQISQNMTSERENSPNSDEEASKKTTLGELYGIPYSEWFPMRKPGLQFRNDDKAQEQGSQPPDTQSIVLLTSTTGILASTRNITALIETQSQNTIHVYYDCPQCKPGDYLLMFENTSFHKQFSQVFFHAMKRTSAFVDTGIKPTAYRYMTPQDEHSSMVFPSVRVEMYRNHKIIQSASSTNFHNWMEKLQPSLEDFIPSELFIPGTHQSGAYLRAESDRSWSAKAFTERWILCQNTTIFEQLYNGIRYLDIRAACVKEDDICQHYYVHHGGVEMIPLQAVIDEVNHFMNLTQEIVIISFKEFDSGFDSRKDHEAFIKHLQHEFRSHLPPLPEYPWQTALKYFWSHNKRLIVSYSNRAQENSTLWPRLHQEWCDKRNVTELHDCFHNINRVLRIPATPSVDMVQLTHDWKSVLADLVPWSEDKSVRKWAQELSPYILKWYHKEWHSTANIVAVDFFELTGIVEWAVRVNKKRVLERNLPHVKMSEILA